MVLTIAYPISISPPSATSFVEIVRLKPYRIYVIRSDNNNVMQRIFNTDLNIVILKIDKKISIIGIFYVL